jgi:hypothetical protein
VRRGAEEMLVVIDEWARGHGRGADGRGAGGSAERERGEQRVSSSAHEDLNEECRLYGRARPMVTVDVARIGATSSHEGRDALAPFCPEQIDTGETDRRGDWRRARRLRRREEASMPTPKKRLLELRSGEERCTGRSRILEQSSAPSPCTLRDTPRQSVPRQLPAHPLDPRSCNSALRSWRRSRREPAHEATSAPSTAPDTPGPRR